MTNVKVNNNKSFDTLSLGKSEYLNAVDGRVKLSSKNYSYGYSISNL